MYIIRTCAQYPSSFVASHFNCLLVFGPGENLIAYTGGKSVSLFEVPNSSHMEGQAITAIVPSIQIESEIEIAFLL